MKKQKMAEPDIRIGTLVNAGPGAADYIRQILPYGFESFSLTFWQTCKGTAHTCLAKPLKIETLIEVLDKIIIAKKEGSYHKEGR